MPADFASDFLLFLGLSMLLYIEPECSRGVDAALCLQGSEAAGSAFGVGSAGRLGGALPPTIPNSIYLFECETLDVKPSRKFWSTV